MTPVLELDNITKRFGALTANDGVSLSLAEGEVLALLGENGAGKTTLMNILFGHYAADEGDVRVFGNTLPPGRPRAAIEAGVGMVHQHFALAANMTVLDNVVLGSEPLTQLAISRTAARAKLMEISERISDCPWIPRPGSRGSRWESGSGSRSSRRSTAMPAS